MINLDGRSTSCLLLRLLLLFQSIIQTTQVDVIIQGESAGQSYHEIYLDLPPGVCCKAGDFIFSSAIHGGRVNRHTGSKTAGFLELLPGDIAAIWAERRAHEHSRWRDGLRWLPGCSTRILQTGHGPGEWSYDAPPDWSESVDQPPVNFIGGASYISVPTILPPDQGTIKTLTMEGILGLVWGGGDYKGGQWFASEAARNMIARGGSGGLINSPRSKSKTKRGIISNLKGNVYAQGPSMWVHPDRNQRNEIHWRQDESSL